jgi:hypothetical protein
VQKSRNEYENYEILAWEKVQSQFSRGCGGLAGKIRMSYRHLSGIFQDRLGNNGDPLQLSCALQAAVDRATITIVDLSFQHKDYVRRKANFEAV